MITFLFGMKEKQKAEEMVEISRIYAARLSEENWNYYIKCAKEEIAKFIEENNLIDMSCMDVTMAEGIELTKQVRKKNSNSFIILVADKNMSPMQYIVPDIQAGALLIKPYTAEMLQRVLSEAINSYMLRFLSAKRQEQFVVDSREGRIVISYDKIYYFEARDKKIIVNTGAKEISFYDTMDHLEQQLPDMFERCHRSFIVSKFKITRINLSQNYIGMQDDIFVPLSRTYKKNFKELK